MTPNSIDRELKRMDLEAERRDELLDSELDRVTGGSFLADHPGVVLAAVLLSPAFALGFGIGAAATVASGGSLSAAK